ncbi:MAG: HNH endonuclease [Armatimonas sp.]
MSDSSVDLDAHHITNRNDMPGGGYVAENGISLCETCHRLAEQLWETGTAAPGFTPDDLYRVVGSSHPESTTSV